MNVQAIVRNLLATIIIAISQSAYATTVTGSFVGTITSSFDEFNTAGFGTGNGVLNGRQITGTVTYDTSFAPPDSLLDPNEGFYLTVDDSALWMPIIEVTIGGNAVVVPSFPSPIVSRNADQNIFVDVAGGNVTIGRDLDYQGTGAAFVDYSVVLNLLGGVLGSDAIPTSLSLADFSSGTGTFFLVERVSSGPELREITASYSLSSLSLSSGASGIPEPSTLVVFAIGLGILGIIRLTSRRRQRLTQ